MTVNQQLSSLGATVLQSNVSFSDAHHLNPLLCTIVGLLIAIALACPFFYLCGRMVAAYIHPFLKCSVCIVSLAITLTGISLDLALFVSYSKYTIEVNSETNMSELISNFEIIQKESEYPILTVTPKYPIITVTPK